MGFNFYSIDQSIDFDLRGRLERKINRINENTQTNDLLTQKIQKSIDTEALSHSYDIENQENEYRRLGRVQNPSKALRENFTHLNNAWNYALSLDYSNLDVGHIIDINHILEPSSLGIRRNNVKVSSSDVIRPSGKKLVDQLYESFEIANGLPNLDSSLFLHMRLLYLHPFEDGNGRTVRLYSNAILHNSKIPSLSIPSSERNFYFELLENSYIGLRNRKATGKDNFNLSREEKTLYNYLATKLNTSLDILIDELDKSKTSEIKLDFNRYSNKGYSTFKKRLQTIINKRNLKAKVSFKREGKKITGIKLQGDISEPILSNLIDSMEGLNDFDIIER